MTCEDPPPSSVMSRPGLGRPGESKENPIVLSEDPPRKRPRVTLILLSDTDTDSDSDTDTAPGEEPSLGNEGVASGGDSGAGPKGKGPAQSNDKVTGPSSPGEAAIFEHQEWCRHQMKANNVDNFCRNIADQTPKEDLIEGIKANLLEKVQPIIPRNFSGLDTKQLSDAFYFIDDLCFGGILREKAQKIIIKGMRSESTAGSCQFDYGSNTITIAVNAKMFVNLELDKNGEMMPKKANGLICRDRREVLLSILAHESIHAIIELLCWRKCRNKEKGYESHGKIFKKLAFFFFGHTHFKHSLNYDIDPDAKSYRKADMKAILSKKPTTKLEDRYQVEFRLDGEIRRWYPIRTGPNCVSCSENPLQKPKKWRRIPYDWILRVIPPKSKAGPAAAP